MTVYYPLCLETCALFRADVARMKNDIIDTLKTYDVGSNAIEFLCNTFIHFWHPTMDDISVTISVRCHAMHHAFYQDIVNILSCRNYCIAGKVRSFPECTLNLRDDIMDVSFTFQAHKDEYEQYRTEEWKQYEVETI